MTHEEGSDDGPTSESLPWQQILADDIFLLMTAGLVVPTIFYIVWGLLELANVKVFTP